MNSMKNSKLYVVSSATGITSESGCYKIWITKTDTELIIKQLTSELNQSQIEQIENEMEFKDGMYCVYVGKSENLKQRISYHINKNAKNSTFIKSLNAIFNEEKGNMPNTDRIVSNAVFECVCSSFLCISRSEYEARLINEKFRILNIHENEYPIPLQITEELTSLRKKLSRKGY